MSIPWSQVDLDAQEGGDDHDFVLGPTKFPILVRVSDYAEDRLKRRDRGEDPRSLFGFLGHQSWGHSYASWTDRSSRGEYSVGERIPPELLHDFMDEALEQGRGFVLLDGLDEITTGREEIINCIDTFLDQNVVRRPGNQLVVTSRIAGYHLAPLKNKTLGHVTIKPMSEASILRFTQSWMTEVERQLCPSGNKDRADAAAAKAIEKAETLTKLLREPQGRYAHELMTNPLLASVVATVYYKGEGR